GCNAGFRAHAHPRRAQAYAGPSAGSGAAARLGPQHADAQAQGTGHGGARRGLKARREARNSRDPRIRCASNHARQLYVSCRCRAGPAYIERDDSARLAHAKWGGLFDVYARATPMLTRLQSALAAGACVGVFLCATPAAHAQINIGGTYNSEDAVDYRSMLLGPRAVDFLGMPLNDQARAGGEAYSQDTVSVPGHQCTSWGPQYLVEAGFNIRVFPTFDDEGTVASWTISAWNDYQPLIIYMDGRPPPDPTGLRRSTGFTTGQWQGDTLQTITTDMKDGVLTR